MLGIIVHWVCLISLIIAIVSLIINDKINFNKIIDKIIFCTCFIGFALFLISLIIGVLNISIISTDTTPEHYYKMAEEKLSIEKNLKAYEEEIYYIQKNKINENSLTYKDNLINLQERIDKYNLIVKTHKERKESWLFYKWCNKDVAKLKLFPSIFGNE